MMSDGCLSGKAMGIGSRQSSILALPSLSQMPENSLAPCPGPLFLPGACFHHYTVWFLLSALSRGACCSLPKRQLVDFFSPTFKMKNKEQNSTFLWLIKALWCLWRGWVHIYPGRSTKTIGQNWKNRGL